MIKTKYKKINYIFIVLLIFLFSSFPACQKEEKIPPTTTNHLIYAIETDGIVCGFGEAIYTDITELNKPLKKLEHTIQSDISLLGFPVKNKVRSVFLIDPETGEFVQFRGEIDQQTVKIIMEADINENIADVRLTPGVNKKVTLTDNVLLDNGVKYDFLLRDFKGHELESKTYKTFDIIDGNINKCVYTKTGEKKVKLAGYTFDVLLFDYLNLNVGMKLHLWIDKESGYALRMKSFFQDVYLADPSIKTKTKTAAVDDHIFAGAGISIPQIWNISYLKVEANLEPIGGWMTEESLNVSGQTFSGTVDNNLIQGIFEISHRMYDGQNAPPFPPDFSHEKNLRPFIEPEDFIESNDPVLIAKAQELTNGASDSWDAAKKISRWVADEIGYEIPGGAAARNTYDLKAGDCGAHSRLFAAFCRAVGIPARVIWGCMYVPNRGGAFGQHGWNEVYMGEAGWIPIDTTAKEVDYIDSGHIRLGILNSKHIAFHPIKMRILDYRLGRDEGVEKKESGSLSEFQPYLGEYSGPRGTVKVFEQNNNLAVDLPNLMTLELSEPDDEGYWVSRQISSLKFSFEKDEGNKVVAMTLINTVRISKNREEADPDKSIPEEFRLFCGVYPTGQGDFEVIYSGNGLAFKLAPNVVADLKGPDKNGRWKVTGQNYQIKFVKDDNGKVNAIMFYEIIPMRKID